MDHNAKINCQGQCTSAAMQVLVTILQFDHYRFYRCCRARKPTCNKVMLLHQCEIICMHANLHTFETRSMSLVICECSRRSKMVSSSPSSMMDRRRVLPWLTSGKSTAFHEPTSRVRVVSTMASAVACCEILATKCSRCAVRAARTFTSWGTHTNTQISTQIIYMQKRAHT